MEKKFNFLLIDDDEIFNFLSKRTLLKYEIANNITVFNDAIEALKYIEDNKSALVIDIILLDIRMPRMDGFEFLNEFMKLDFNETYVYMLTSSLDERDVKRALKYEMVKGFYSKPLTVEILSEIYEKQLNK
jgi:response regulator RpfG family c-di-GMP phosphodiesterase